MKLELKDTENIRRVLTEEIELIKDGKSTPARANAISNLVGKILNSVKLDIEVHKYIAKVDVTELATPLIKGLKAKA